jgi:hypothetical protein
LLTGVVGSRSVTVKTSVDDVRADSQRLVIVLGAGERGERFGDRLLLGWSVSPQPGSSALGRRLGSCLGRRASRFRDVPDVLGDVFAGALQVAQLTLELVGAGPSLVAP